MKKKLPLVIYFSFLIIYLELVYKALVLNNVFSINSLVFLLLWLILYYVVYLVKKLIGEYL